MVTHTALRTTGTFSIMWFIALTNRNLIFLSKNHNSSAYNNLSFICISGAWRSRCKAGATGQGAGLAESGRWSEKHHDTECGPDPGSGRETGRTHGQVRGPASRGQSQHRTLCFMFSVYVLK